MSAILVAAHEAGHTLVAEAVGCDVTMIEVGRTSGSCRYIGRWAPAISQLRIVVAGYAGEHVALGQSLRMQRGPDLTASWEIARWLRSTLPREQRREVTISRLRRREIDVARYYLEQHRAQLVTLANALLDVEPDADGVRRMSGDRVREVLGAVEALPARRIEVPPMPAPACVETRTRPSPSRPWRESIAASAARRRAS